jgi:hypothetical protein
MEHVVLKESQLTSIIKLILDGMDSSESLGHWRDSLENLFFIVTFYEKLKAICCLQKITEAM